MRIAFAGNPNSGKTTMYNALTGRNEKVGNWAGVTVDKKEAMIKKAYSGGRELIAVDLPGAEFIAQFLGVFRSVGLRAGCRDHSAAAGGTDVHYRRQSAAQVPPKLHNGHQTALDAE